MQSAHLGSYVRESHQIRPCLDREKDAFARGCNQPWNTQQFGVHSILAYRTVLRRKVGCFRIKSADDDGDDDVALATQMPEPRTHQISIMYMIMRVCCRFKSLGEGRESAKAVLKHADAAVKAFPCKYTMLRCQ